MIGDIMKSGVVESDRVKIEGRQSMQRRKMSKNAPIVNGAADDSVGYEEDSMVIRQVNLAAAYHDHISCTKSAELCKISDTKEGRVNLPCETDHIYANCSDKSKSHNPTNTSPSKERKDEEKRQLQDMCLLQLELINHLQEENAAKEKKIQMLAHQLEMVNVQHNSSDADYSAKKCPRCNCELDGILDEGSALADAQMSQATSSTEVQPMTHSAVHLVTRYFGRRSKTIPSRALKRRYFGPPKSFPCKKSKYTPSNASMSSASENQDEEKQETEHTDSNKNLSGALISEEHRRPHKKNVRRAKVIPKMEDFLTTDKEYYLPVHYHTENVLDETENIDVPSWRFRPVSSFYQMEGTENIDDKVFQRRHLKCEQDEKRRKRWDIQRLREQRVAEKLKYKHGGSNQNGDSLLQRKTESLYPNPNNFEFIEVTEKLPVLAFGQPIPLFQPSEFSLPWKVNSFKDATDKKTGTAGVRVT